MLAIRIMAIVEITANTVNADGDDDPTSLWC